MLFRVLGPLEIRRPDGRPVAFTEDRQARLITLLLLYANEWLDADVAAAELWPDGPPASVTGGLRVAAHQLRQALPRTSTGSPRINSRADSYRINVEASELDAMAFDGLVAQGRAALSSGDPATAVERFRSALGLWRGEPFDLLTSERARAGKARFTELRWAARDGLADGLVAAGRPGHAVKVLRRLAEIEPGREPTWYRLVDALDRDGRREEAIRAFEQFRDATSSGPSAQFRLLYEQILEADASRTSRIGITEFLSRPLPASSVDEAPVGEAVGVPSSEGQSTPEPPAEEAAGVPSADGQPTSEPVESEPVEPAAERSIAELLTSEPASSDRPENEQSTSVRSALEPPRPPPPSEPDPSASASVEAEPPKSEAVRPKADAPPPPAEPPERHAAALVSDVRTPDTPVGDRPPGSAGYGSPYEQRPVVPPQRFVPAQRTWAPATRDRFDAGSWASPKRRRRPLVALAVLLVVALGGVAAVLWWPQLGGPSGAEGASATSATLLPPGVPQRRAVPGAGSGGDPELLFGVGDSAETAMKDELVTGTEARMLTTRFRGTEDDVVELLLWRDTVVREAYSDGYALHLVIADVSHEGPLDVSGERVCGRPYALSAEFLADAELLAVTFAGQADGPPLFVTMFDGVQDQACTDGAARPDPSTENYYRALSAQYLKAREIFNRVAPNALVSLGWNSGQAGYDDPDVDGGISMIRYFEQLLRWSDFATVSTSPDDDGVDDARAAVRELSGYGPVMLSHGPSPRFDDQVRELLDDDFLDDADGVFAWTFSADALRRASPDSRRFVADAVARYGRPAR